MKINIKAIDMPGELKNKAVLIRRDRNKRIYAFKGSWSGNWLGGSSKIMGDFFIMADTTAPKITPFNIREGKDMKHSFSIKIKISDNLSGIRSYRATIDGRWILMEYDPKRLMLTYTFEENLSSGTHSLDLVVYDVVDNISKLNLIFNR